MEKTQNNKAWFLVLPVLVLVAFSAVIPLMTVVNYSVNDTFGDNQFFGINHMSQDKAQESAELQAAQHARVQLVLGIQLRPVFLIHFH